MPPAEPVGAAGAEPPEHFAGTIVALGASAGGLEALDRFFTALPPLEGTAFVVIQHLAPEHKTMMDTLLARHTAMPVRVASDAVALEGRHVYVIPPGATMTVSSGRLRVAPRPATGVTLPIDAFFESLAHEAGSRAIGIVMSGTGSDGTRGALALDEAGAWVLVQDPQTARFDGMPRSVIGSGVADQVLSPEALAAEVATIITSGEQRAQRTPGHAARDELTAEAVLKVLASVMRIDFSQYKPNTLLRRVERRITAVGAPSLQAYADHLASHPGEVDLLRREILIPVTRFFRDADAFTVLRDQALRPMLQQRASRPGEPLRAWVAGTATGEEAYSITMLLLELIAEVAPALQLKVFATDVESAYLERAAAGRYGAADLADVDEARRRRWFVPLEGGQWQVRPELRQHIVFSRHDLIVDAPFTNMDLVSCRNLLIYLRPAAQDRAVRRLSYALRLGGILLLGGSETPTASAGLLETIDTRQKVFRLVRRPTSLPPEDLLRERDLAGRAVVGGRGSLETVNAKVVALRAADALLSQYGPPSMLLSADRQLVHTFGDVRRLLRFRPGEASLDVLSLLPPALMPIVATLLHSVLRDRTPQRSQPLKLQDHEGGAPAEAVRVAVWPLEEPGGRIDHVLVAFERPADAAPEGPPMLAETALSAISSQQVVDLERELENTRAILNDSMQELGTTNEELQATNEELMAANEELQSTNEELQSVNEELHSVNAELQIKVDELNNANTDLESLSRAARIPLVFLDAGLRLTRFTVEAGALFHLREGDVGRPLTDFNHDLEYPELHDDIRDAMRGPVLRQREVRDRDGRYWLVTILPYASEERRRTRAVISCIDVSSLRDVRRLQSVMDALPEHLAVLDRDGTIQMVNRAWREFAERNGDPTLRRSGPGTNYLELCRGVASEDVHARRAVQGLSGVLDGSRPAFMMIYPCHSPEEERWFLMHVGPLGGGGVVVSHFNITGWVDPSRLDHLLEGSP
jgi:two-component system CheB/CheR fusion protein